MTRAYAVTLTIPDNEAYTALVALQRLGIVCASAERADVWRFEVDDDRVGDLDALVPTIETVANPNKSRLTTLADARPRPHEVWIAEPEDETQPQPVVLGGRVLPGVRAVHRLVSWRLRDATGAPLPENELRRAVDLLLCNRAFQRAEYSS